MTACRLWVPLNIGGALTPWQASDGCGFLVRPLRFLWLVWLILRNEWIPSLLRRTPMASGQTKTGLICFDLSTPFKEILLVLFSGMKKLVVGAVDMWARGARVWAGGGQRASVVHGLSTRPEGRAPVRKDSSTYPPRSRTWRRAYDHRKRRHGDERVGSGQGRADCDGGSC